MPNVSEIVRTPIQSVEQAVPFVPGEILFKHSAIIHVIADITASARKIYNVLLLHAQRDGMEPGRTHEIRCEDVENALDLEANNRRRLEASVRTLVTTPCQFNVLGKDAQNVDEWERINSNLLADVGFPERSGTCRFSFSPRMARLLTDPNVYCRIDIARQRRFRGKHALVLYEYYLDALYANRQVAEICTSIEEYRMLLAIKPDRYTLFKVFRRDVIERAHKEINTHGDLHVEEIDRTVRNHHVISLTVRVERRRAPETNLGGQVRQPVETQLPASGTDDREKENLRRMLIERQVNASVADHILGQHDASRVLTNITYVDGRKRSGKLNNPAAYLVRAVENDYAGKIQTPDTRGSRGGRVTPSDIPRVEPDPEEPWVRSARAFLDRIGEEEGRALRAEFEASPDFTAIQRVSRRAGPGNPFYESALLQFVAKREGAFEP